MQQKIKYGGIVILSSALCLLLHILLPAALTTDTPADSLSGLAQQLGFPLAALLWAIMAYGCLSVVFYLIGNRIPGKKKRPWSALRLRHWRALAAGLCNVPAEIRQSICRRAGRRTVRCSPGTDHGRNVGASYRFRIYTG